MEVEQARAAYETACQSFDAATHALLEGCMRQQALDLALKRGLRADDPLCTEIDKGLASASMRVWEARQARDTAAETLKAAETPPRRPLLETQLEVVMVHHPKLAERYAAEVEAVEQADSADEIARRKWILGNTKRQILAFEPPAAVTP